jgi:hypothetical protein
MTIVLYASSLPGFHLQSQNTAPLISHLGKAVPGRTKTKADTFTGPAAPFTLQSALSSGLHHSQWWRHTRGVSLTVRWDFYPEKRPWETAWIFWKLPLMTEFAWSRNPKLRGTSNLQCAFAPTANPGLHDHILQSCKTSPWNKTGEELYALFLITACKSTIISAKKNSTKKSVYRTTKS